ncbi:MAG TPA: hypothetical protein VFN68_04830 [Acidimicrobiales bacterium]|nr:hypothetical protein [Acidimicrobiales bacterium]
MGSYFKLVAAGPAFFLSAWLLMLFAGAISPDVGIRPFGYTTSMIATIALWLALAPAIGAISGRAGGPRRRAPGRPSAP